MWWVGGCRCGGWVGGAGMGADVGAGAGAGMGAGAGAGVVWVRSQVWVWVWVSACVKGGGGVLGGKGMITEGIALPACNQRPLLAPVQHRCLALAGDLHLPTTLSVMRVQIVGSWRGPWWWLARTGIDQPQRSL